MTESKSEPTPTTYSEAPGTARLPAYGTNEYGATLWRCQERKPWPLHSSEASTPPAETNSTGK